MNRVAQFGADLRPEPPEKSGPARDLPGPPAFGTRFASRYMQLVEDVTRREAIFTRLQAEWHDSIDVLCDILQQRTLLERNPPLERNIRHRFPYIDPLNHVQLELLRRYRAGDTDDRRRAGRPPGH